MSIIEKQSRMANAKLALHATSIKARMKSFRKMVDHLLLGKVLTIHSMQVICDIGVSCSRKYRDILVTEKVMHLSPVERWAKPNSPEFILCADGAIKAELLFVRMQATIVEPKKPSVKFSTLMPGTRIHIAEDDNDNYTRHVRNAIVRAVRHPLDVALFGDGPAPSLLEVVA